MGNLATPIKVQELRTALHAKAKEAPDFRFYALYDKVYRTDVLAYAYRRCRFNGGAEGVDGQRFEDIETYGEERWLGELAQELRDKKYQAQVIRRVYIPKPGGKLRPLGIATIRDRVVMMAAMLVLEPIFEADLQPEQHAYRVGHNAHTAVGQVLCLLYQGYTQVIDADLSSYFDTLPHPELLRSLARRICDRQMLHLIKMWLTVAVEEDDGRGGKKRTTVSRDQKRGTPQGSPISPLLSNIYMRRFILGWRNLGHADRFRAHVVNYADDLVICCGRHGDEALAQMRRLMQRLKLTVNEEKTRLCFVPNENFEFLGYAFGRCYSRKTGRAYLGSRPSTKSVRRLIRRISTETARWRTHRDVEEVVEELNDVLRGWAGYFRLGAVSKAYRILDNHTKNRLRRWLCAKHKIKGPLRTHYPDRYMYERLGLICLPRLTQRLPWALA